MLGAPMAHSIGDGFVQKLLKVDRQPQRDRSRLAIGADAAIDGPLLPEPLCEGTQLGSNIAKLNGRVSPERRYEAPQLALLFDQQALEFVKIGIDCRTRFRSTLDRLDAKGGTGEELDDAVVDVARDRKASSCGSAGLDCRDQRVPAEDCAGGVAKLPSELEIVGRQVRDAPQNQPSLLGLGANFGNEPVAEAKAPRLVDVEGLARTKEAEAALRLPREDLVCSYIE